jgi:TolB-like protein
MIQNEGELFMTKRYFILLSIIAIVNILWAGGEWYSYYEQGLKEMEQQNWNAAADLFRQAIVGNPKDNTKVRTYGMHFIQYFPHRELGICLYHLGDMEAARRELNVSLTQNQSTRAKEYMDKVSSGSSSSTRRGVQTAVTPPMIPAKPKEEEVIKPVISTPVEKKRPAAGSVKLVGERMGVAILPFENKGASRDLGDIILDKMITCLVNQERFKVMERSQLDKILAEQSLGASGVLDAETAAEIGKGIGVDGIIIGSVAATSSGAISVDARVIDTESAAIIVAQDIYSSSSDAQSVKSAIDNLARKITQELPLVEGYVIQIDGPKVILDNGRNNGLKKGMKCVVYKEGGEIKHPLTGEILGKDTVILAEILITESFDKYCVAKSIKSEGGLISIGDKFLTK